ncbi:MAG TPA: hypothetical protein GX532_07170 [Clostridia bacterium]|nr:hypothetical protein [Clostridia bacterium]
MSSLLDRENEKITNLEIRLAKKNYMKALGQQAIAARNLQNASLKYDLARELLEKIKEQKEQLKSFEQIKERYTKALKQHPIRPDVFEKASAEYDLAIEQIENYDKTMQQIKENKNFLKHAKKGYQKTLEQLTIASDNFTATALQYFNSIATQQTINEKETRKSLRDIDNEIKALRSKEKNRDGQKSHPSINQEPIR